jgi:hypothetical protein
MKNKKLGLAALSLIIMVPVLFAAPQNWLAAQGHACRLCAFCKSAGYYC